MILDIDIFTDNHFKNLRKLNVNKQCCQLGNAKSRYTPTQKDFILKLKSAGFKKCI